MTDLARHARSAAVRNPRLDMFQLPPTNLSMAAVQEVCINPQTTGIHPIVIQVEPTTDFINLDRSYVEVELQLKTTGAANIVEATRIQLANNLAHILFKQISVRLNGTLMSPQTDTYHYLAMIETLLNNDKQDTEDLLQPQGYYDCIDVPSGGDADAITANQQDPTHADYAALSESRKNLIQSRIKFLGGNRVVLRFTPALEVFRLGRLLPPKVQIQMEMYLNDPSFWTVRQGDALVLRLTEADIKVRFYVQQVRLQPSVYRVIIMKMNSGKRASFPTVRSAIRTYSHPTDNRHFECDNPFHGQVPNRLVIALLKQTAFNGTITENPFHFGKFNLKTIKLLISGEEYPTRPWNSITTDRTKITEVTTAFCKPRVVSRGQGNLIKAKDWGHGKKGNLFVFDTTSNDSLDSPVLNPKQSGEVRVVLDFGANPGSNLTILLYGEFENVLEITGQGTVTYDVHHHT